MEKNTKISILKKIVIILLAIIICYFIIPNPVNAASWIAEAGGVLIEWILQLFIFLGDCILNILQNNFISSEDMILTAQADSQAGTMSLGSIISIILGLLIVVVAICVAVASWGTLSWASLAGIAAGIKMIGGVILVSAAGTALFVQGTNKMIDELSGEFDLPRIRYTPYEIFSGQIPVFDVNFINPMESIFEEKTEEEKKVELSEDGKKYNIVTSSIYTPQEAEENVFTYETKDINDEMLIIPEVTNKFFTEGKFQNQDLGYGIPRDTSNGPILEMSTVKYNFVDSQHKFVVDGEEFYPDKVIYEHIWDHNGNSYRLALNVWYTAYTGLADTAALSKAEVVGYNEFLGADFNVYLINSSNSLTLDEFATNMLIDKGYINSSETITLRQEEENYVFEGNSENGVKYKVIAAPRGGAGDINNYDVAIYDEVVEYESLDETYNGKKYKTETVKEYKSSASILQSSISTWYRVLRTIALVGLLSIIVYVGIRILLTSIAEDKAKYKKMLIDWVVAICILFILHYLMVFILTISSSLTEIFLARGEENILVALPEDTTVNGEKLQESGSTDPAFEGRPAWSTSFVGYVRLLAGSYNAEENAGLMNIAYAIIYIVLVIYTLMFTFMYLKRAIYMAFLTMIAPLIALTYPLDKIKDGKAQAFSLWLREYIFNALMQPVHLILYTMLISIVMEYVQDHPVYALVAIGFLIPAEQFVRKMFGFEKAGTVSELGKLAGGAALMSGINKLANLNKRRQTDESEDKNAKVRTKEEGGYGLDFPNAVNTNQQQASSHNTETRGGGRETVRTNSNTPRAEGASGAQNNQTENTYPERTRNIRQQSSQGATNVNSAVNDINQNITKGQTQNSASSSENNRSSGGFIDRFSAGMNSVGMHYKNKAIKAKPLRTAGRWTGRILGGAALGTIGLAAGIASGDVGKAFSYTAAGAGVGGALGGTISENAMDEGKAIRENFAKGYQGDSEYTNPKLDDKFFASAEYQNIINNHSLYPELLGDPISQRERMAKIHEEIMQYRRSGITDSKKTVKAMKLKLTPKQGAYAIQLAERIGKSGWNKEETRLRYYNDYFGKLGNQEEAKKIWEAIPKLLF